MTGLSCMQVRLVSVRLAANTRLSLGGSAWTGVSLVRSAGVMFCPVSSTLSSFCFLSVFSDRILLWIWRRCRVTTFCWTTHTNTHTAGPSRALTCQSSSPCHALCQTTYSLPSLSPLLSHSSPFVNRDEAFSGDLFIISNFTSCLPSSLLH